MEGFAGIYYWIRLGILMLVSVLAIVVAIRLMRTRKFTAWRGVAVSVLEIVILAGAWLVTGASPSPVWVIVLLAVGAVLGFLAGRSAKPVGEKLRRSPLAAAFTALAFIFAAMTLLFGTSYLFSIALLVLAFAAGTLTGQFAGEVQAARSVVAPPAMPGPPAASTPPPLPVAPPPMPGESF